MPHPVTTRGAVITCVLAFLLAAPLVAQTDSTPRSSWDVYQGCWSTSSAGAIGPMVCVVPDSTPTRAEVLSVVRDSVVSRLVIDADGKLRAFARGGCNGFERAHWSPDGQRLYMRAEYRCGRDRVSR